MLLAIALDALSLLKWWLAVALQAVVKREFARRPFGGFRARSRFVVFGVYRRIRI